MSLLYALPGLIFLVLGLFLARSLRPLPTALPILLFHLFGGIVISLTPLDPLTISFVRLRSFSLTLAAISLLHFFLIHSEISLPRRVEKSLYPALYGFGVLLGFLQTVLGHSDHWGLLLIVTVHLFGIIVCLYRILRDSRRYERILSGFLLAGLVVAFPIPLIIRSPAVAPLTLGFPILFLVGLTVARRSQSQSYRIQSAKRSSFSEFLAGLTHELNNPLNFITATMSPYKERLTKLKAKLPAGDAESEKLFEELEKMTGTIEEGAKRASQLVESFRNYPSSNVRGPKESVDLNQIIEQSIEILAPKWKGRLQVETNFNPVGTLQGYPGELAQVFTNIIANACEATPDQGTVSVATHKGTSGARVTIRDTGKGIPRETLEKIFDPFFTTKEPQEGTGLGLAISMQIIKSHKGSIEVSSEVGKGTEFVVTLPYG